MCTAHKLKMTQREGYVWFLPGWFEYNWYDVDALAREKEKKQGEMKDKGEGQGFKLGINKNTLGPLPDCTT